MKTNRTTKVGQTCRGCGRVIKEGARHFDMTGEACWEWREMGTRVAPTSRRAVDLHKVGIYDLIYDDRAWARIKERFPSATQQDASDCIHERRIGVDIPDVDRGRWFRFLVQEGLAGISLYFNLSVAMGDKAFLRQCLEWTGHPVPTSLEGEDEPCEVREIR